MILGSGPYLDVAGVMRCCIQTWQKYETFDSLPTDEGAVIQCDFATTSDHRLVLHGDTWEWQRE